MNASLNVGSTLYCAGCVSIIHMLDFGIMSAYCYSTCTSMVTAVQLNEYMAMIRHLRLHQAKEEKEILRVSSVFPAPWTCCSVTWLSPPSSDCHTMRI